MEVAVKREIQKVKIDFNKAHITYQNANGQPIVGVTTALGLLDKPALIFWAYNKGKAGENLYEKGESANIGTVIHERIKAFFLGYEIDNYNISPEVWDLSTNSLSSFFSFTKGKKIEPILIESALISEKYQYGGTLDFYGRIDDILELWDHKTGSGIYDTHIYQLVALSNLLIENGYDPPQRLRPINIPKSSDDSFDAPDLNASEREDEFQIFLNLKDIYYLQKKLKLKRKGKV